MENKMIEKCETFKKLFFTGINSKKGEQTKLVNYYIQYLYNHPNLEVQIEQILLKNTHISDKEFIRQNKNLYIRIADRLTHEHENDKFIFNRLHENYSIMYVKMKHTGASTRFIDNFIQKLFYFPNEYHIVKYNSLRKNSELYEKILSRLEHEHNEYIDVVNVFIKEGSYYIQLNLPIETDQKIENPIENIKTNRLKYFEVKQLIFNDILNVGSYGICRDSGQSPSNNNLNSFTELDFRYENDMNFHEEIEKNIFKFVDNNFVNKI
jgi:hypothetical protein